MTWAKLALAALQLFNLLASLWKSSQDKQAGRNEAVLAGKKAAEEEEAIAREEEAAPVDPNEPDEFMRKD
jgi:hypothetical protein